MADTLTREQMAAQLGVPASRLHYSPRGAARLNRKMRRKLAKLARRKAK